MTRVRQIVAEVLKKDVLLCKDAIFLSKNNDFPLKFSFIG